jgi:hypothetical protein
MNMPGFTAENSLYISRAQYNAGGTTFLAANAEIVPQIREVCEVWAAHAREHLARFVDSVFENDFDRASIEAAAASRALGYYSDLECPED